MQFRRLALAASSILFAAGLGFAAGPGAAGSAPAAKKLVVAVSVLPQAYFVERVGGDRVRAFALELHETILARRGKAGLDMAFFTLNGVVSCALGVAGIIDLLN